MNDPFVNDPDVSVDAWEAIADQYCWRCYAIGIEDLGYTMGTNWIDWEPEDWVDHYAIKYGLERVDDLWGYAR